MRKQVQKERCTKIMLTKCKAVCCLYDKVQLAAAKMLDIANLLYDNNPFIEALPPMLSGRALIHALAVIPPYSDNDRDRSTGERLQLLSSLYEFYQPLSMTIDLYCEIYTAMQHCYGQYSVQSEAAAMQNGYSLMHGNALAASIGGGNSFSVVGVSGLGKSTALQRVLSLYPQVIEHTEYHGQKFYCHQIPYLVVQTPHDASIKALILDIYLQIDSLIGTCYQRDAAKKAVSRTRTGLSAGVRFIIA